MWEDIARIPKPLRAAAARALTWCRPAAWTRLGDAAGGLLAARIARLNRLGDKVHKGAPMLRSDSSTSFTTRCFAVARPGERW